MRTDETTTIRRFDLVRVLRPVPRYGLEAGAIGTVLDIYADGAAVEVEFPEMSEALVTATLSVSDVALAQDSPARVP